jgi:hypothetical protein
VFLGIRQAALQDGSVVLGERGERSSRAIPSGTSNNARPRIRARVLSTRPATKAAQTSG